MSVIEIIDFLLDYLKENWLELVAVITGFICVFFNARENVWGWPLGIISCFLYIFIFYDTKLYPDMWLQIMYVGLNMYGWYQWLFGGENKKELKITTLRWKEASILIPSGLLLTLLSYYFFSTYTDAAQPFWDSFNTAFSLVAVYLMAKKRLENWLIWIMVDIIYVPLVFSRGLYLTAFLYLSYLVLATYGYIQWRKNMSKQHLPVQHG